VLALSMCLAGCGGGSAGGTLPRPALLSLANAICAPAAGSLTPPSYVHGVAAARYFDRLASAVARETRALQALQPASDIEPSWHAFVAKQVTADRLVQRVHEAYDRHDPAASRLVEQLRPASQAVVDAASALGAKRCAR
jgi:hypothetical protein